MCIHTKDNNDTATIKQERKSFKGIHTATPKRINKYILILLINVTCQSNHVPDKLIDSTCFLSNPLGSYPPLSYPPLPRFPCTRCLRERSRAIVLQYCQSWRRIYNPSGFLVSLLPGVTELLGMDASSSLSKYPFKDSGWSYFRLFPIRTKSPCYNE